MPRCVVPFCGNTSANGGMFTFPDDPARNLQWRVNMKRSKSPRGALWVNSKYSRICSEHFEEDCFVLSRAFAASIDCDQPRRLQLKPGAVPTIFKRTLPNVRPVTPPRPTPRGAFCKRRRAEILREILDSEDQEPTQTTSTAPPPAPIHTDLDHSYAEFPDQVSEPSTAPPHDDTHDDPDIPEMCVPTDITNYPVARKAYTKKVGTPKSWMPKPQTPKPSTRTFSTQTDAVTIVDEPCICRSTPHAASIPTDLPSTSALSADDDASVMSEMEWDGDGDDGDDPDYDPDMDTDDSDDNPEPLLENKDPKDERKYIVFESALKELLNICRVCGSQAEVRRRAVRGTMVVLESVCVLTPSHVRQWQNQPSHRGLPVGNLLIAGSILFSGSSPVKAINMLKFVNIQCFCRRTYHAMQSAYLLPAIDSIWEDEREAQLQMVKGPLSLGGDARCCSPGHTAKYGSYTLMNLETSKVMEMRLIQSNEVANSNAMELEGLKRAMTALLGENVEIASLTTDRHPQIKKYMREEHADIQHWYDVWHVAKAVKKKVEAAGKRKGCEILCQWSHSISNHIYYCAATSKGNGEMLVEMWRSLLNHVVDIHHGHGLLYPSCLHEPLEDRQWIKKDSKPHKELRDVVERKMLIKDIQKLSPRDQTSSVESFHTTCCYFATKFVHFFYLSMEGRLKLASLHFNENSNKPQDVTKSGTLKWAVFTPKYKKGVAIAKPTKALPTYNYVDRLLEEVLIRREELPSYRQCFEDLAPVFEAQPQPVSSQFPINKENTIARHQSRFIH